MLWVVYSHACAHIHTPSSNIMHRDGERGCVWSIFFRFLWPAEGPLSWKYPPSAIIAIKAKMKDPRAEPRYNQRVKYVVVYGAPGRDHQLA